VLYADLAKGALFDLPDTFVRHVARCRHGVATDPSLEVVEGNQGLEDVTALLKGAGRAPVIVAPPWERQALRNEGVTDRRGGQSMQSGYGLH
jgi:hypothetical protein